METVSALLAICAGHSPVTGEFPAQRPVMRSFYVFFDLRLNKRLSKQLWGWWYETPLCQLWRDCSEIAVCPVFLPLLGHQHHTYDHLERWSFYRFHCIQLYWPLRDVVFLQRFHCIQRYWPLREVVFLQIQIQKFYWHNHVIQAQ